MSIKYTTLSTINYNRGPKSSLMKPWFSRRARSLITSYGPTTVTASSTINTKGAWVQVVSSTSGDVGGLRIRFNNYAGATPQSTLLDIGIGPAGSERVIISDIPVGAGANSAFGGLHIEIPISIPRGTRIAVRAQSERASNSVGVYMVPHAASDVQTTPTLVDSLGVVSATSSGTAMAGASGSYTQIIASTTRDYQALILMPALSAGINGVINNIGFVFIFTLAIGPAGSEVDITQTVFIADSGIGMGNILSIGDRGGGFIPAGTRISVKHNQPSNPGRYSAVVIGVPYV